MTRDDIIRLAQEVNAEISAYINYYYDEEVVVFYKGQLEQFAALVAAAEREQCERLKHAMREAMYLLDQPEPRPHAAFSELLLALKRRTSNDRQRTT